MRFQRQEVIMKKYELQEGEEFIDEYIDNDGEHVTILKDKNGKIMHGWSIEMDAETADMIERAAATIGLSAQEYMDMALETMVKKLIEETEKKSAIEEISD